MSLQRAPSPATLLAIPRPPSLTSAVVERLRQSIVDAALPLGGELSEVGLAKLYGVSRTPVREALNTLQLQGMVTIVPQRGTFVFLPDEQDIVDICEFRLVIELKALGFALARRREATVSDLQAALTEMEAARAAGDTIAYSRADTNFHESFIRNCRNRYLEDSYKLAAGKIATLRTHLSAPLAGVQARSYLEHKEMADAFARGDLASLEPVLTNHILKTCDSYLVALQQGLIRAPAP